MIFIKNLTNLEGSDIKINLNRDGEEVSVSLTIAKETPFTLAKSTIEGVASALKNSVEHIGGIVNVLNTDDANTSTCLVSDNVTELNFLVKNTKTVLKETALFPVTISAYTEDDETNNVHYPRDMIIFIVPAAIDGVKKEYTLVADRRNLGAATLVHDIGEYRIIGMFLKWPIWARLKFPAYAYIRGDGEEVLDAIKLGSKTEKKITKNVVQDVDVKEAVDYLTESFRILKEKRDKKETFNRQENNNKDRRYTGNKYQNQGNVNKGSGKNYERGNFNSKFKSGNTTDNNKGSKNKDGGRRK